MDVTNFNPNAVFPPSLDFKFYRNQNQDLRSFSDFQLKEHYESFGRREGRLASPAASRRGFVEILRKIDPALEIGPFDRPLLSQERAKFFDVVPAELLKLRASNLPDRNPATVPNIDYYSPTGDLSIIMEKFLLVASSHSIEHTPDVVQHFNQVEQLLETGGCYAALIPDCRYCFDHYLPQSTIAEVLGAHFEGRNTHTLTSVIEHRALTTHNDPAEHWKGNHGHSGADETKKIRNAIAEWRAANGAYIDVHAWQFTPGGFLEISMTLYDLGLMSLSPLRVYDTPYGSNEFCVVLVKQ